MSFTQEILVIDAGNTSIKVGIFNDSMLIRVERFAYFELLSSEFTSKYKDSLGILSSVRSTAETNELLSKFSNIKLVDDKTIPPLTIKYKTPQTLGVDRICNACGMQNKLQTDYGISIDIGTCIKFDLVSQDGTYFGGSISPGIDLRYKSLNDYTGNLPLLSNKSTPSFVGTDTNESIQSGVINGIKAEIEGMMAQYSNTYNSLTFFVTGGDAKFFELHSKNDIFADDNLTLQGLFEIYKANA